MATGDITATIIITEIRAYSNVSPFDCCVRLFRRQTIHACREEREAQASVYGERRKRCHPAGNRLAAAITVTEPTMFQFNSSPGELICSSCCPPLA